MIPIVPFIINKDFILFACYPNQNLPPRYCDVAESFSVKCSIILCRISFYRALLSITPALTSRSSEFRRSTPEMRTTRSGRPMFPARTPAPTTHSLKSYRVHFEEVVRGFHVRSVGVDLLLQLVLSVHQSVVLVRQVSGELDPSLSLSVLSVLQVLAGLNQLLSQLRQQLQDSLDRLLVHLGGQLGEGSQDRLEECAVALVLDQSLLHGLELGSQLGEGRAQRQVLHELGGFVDRRDGLVVLVVLAHPGVVLLVAVGLLGSVGLLVVLNVLAADNGTTLPRWFGARPSRLQPRPSRCRRASERSRSPGWCGRGWRSRGRW